MDVLLKRAISLREELKEIIDLFFKYGYTPDNAACDKSVISIYNRFVFLYNGVNECIIELSNNQENI